MRANARECVRSCALVRACVRACVRLCTHAETPSTGMLFICGLLLLYTAAVVPVQVRILAGTGSAVLAIAHFLQVDKIFSCLFIKFSATITTILHSGCYNCYCNC